MSILVVVHNNSKGMNNNDSVLTIPYYLITNRTAENLYNNSIMYLFIDISTKF